MNLFDTSQVSSIQNVKKEPAPVENAEKKVSPQFPMKPGKSGSLDETRNCRLTHYDGNVTVQGWYEQEEIYGEKTLVLKIAPADIPKLPQKIQQWSDGAPLESVLLDNVNSRLKTLLLKASAQEPTDVNLVSVDVYCEGLPVVKVAQK